MGLSGARGRTWRGRAALAGAALLLGAAACTSGGGGKDAAAGPGPGGSLCRALITAEDVPPGFAAAPSTPPCDDTQDTQTAQFPGAHGGLEVADELLRRVGPAEAADGLGRLVEELNVLSGRPEEQDAAAFRDLGDEARYFHRHLGQSDWSTLYVRRGGLLVYLHVVRTGPDAFSPAELHAFAAKAVARAGRLG
ncbi:MULTISPECIES: hypothetical protein [Kitasatospora]|uniref:Lipoprotein n=1 Tax=Kitasatospora setae (strain ATCC 33774 / DSM 43861 / JCM 3304 / KCC A-0304 / NBRC 14216 / KM-6054) TaxID=452652 RepID=E4N6W6_KITSK|nr:MULTISPECIES: hypothetical protein [Kitasatospora]BAJ26947.1 hypothetical protein KSE_11130 [Kitasatospora setae KM-6054]